MANLNLSQFGENTSVSDADYTFVWDSAASISKKVSRNSWLNSGELTSSAPVTISQTWGALAQTFTAFKVNAAGTSDANSASGSLLADLQVGGVSKFSVRKDGRTTVGNVIVIGNSLFSWESPYLRTYSSFSCTKLDIGAVGTVLLEFDAANTLALRNGAAAQTFNVYGTSSASNANYTRLALTCGLDGNATISTQALGTGTAGVLAFSPSNTERMRITTAGNVGIGTTSPTSKLQVTGGDVEIETVTSGIIMKAAGTSTRYRITLNATGDALVFTAI